MMSITVNKRQLINIWAYVLYDIFFSFNFPVGRFFLPQNTLNLTMDNLYYIFLFRTSALLLSVSRLRNTYIYLIPHLRFQNLTINRYNTCPLKHHPAKTHSEYCEIIYSKDFLKLFCNFIATPVPSPSSEVHE